MCENAPASFSITATNALAGTSGREDQGSGFNNLSNSGVYSGVTTTTVNINCGCIEHEWLLPTVVFASNGGGSTNSTAAALTVNITGFTNITGKTPASITVADGTPVSASL